MPSFPKFIRRNSSQRTVVGEVHDKLHHNSLKDSAKPRPAVDTGIHEFKAPGKDDLRSVCPALNTLANHGYLPHDGRNISFRTLSHALQAGYGVSPLFADFLVFGGYLLLRQSVLTPLNLEDVGKHNAIEHNASVVHDDDSTGSKDAPTQVNPTLLHKFLTKAYTPECLINADNNDTITIEDIARTRNAREEASQPVDPLHAEIARGEFAMVLNIFGKGKMKTLNAHDLKVWLDENRFPPGWAPSHTEHLVDTVQESKKMRELMQKYRGDHPKNLLTQLEKLSTTQGHGVLAAMWRVIETMLIKLEGKTTAMARAARGRSAMTSPGSTPVNSTPVTPTAEKAVEPIQNQVQTVNAQTLVA